MWVPGLGPPAAHAAWRPSQRALCLGVPRGRRRALRAGLVGSPAGVPGSQGAALVLRVALGAGVVWALGEGGQNSAPSSPTCWEDRGGPQASTASGAPPTPRATGAPAAAPTPVPGDTLAGRACRRGWAWSAGSTGSGGCRGGAGGGCRPGSRPPDPPGSPHSARRWVGGFRRTPGPPLQGRGRRDPRPGGSCPANPPCLMLWDPGDTGGAAQARTALSRLPSPSEHPG